MKWEAPAKRTHLGGARVSYLKEAAELRAHPGEWGIVKEFSVKKQRAAYSFQTCVRYARLRAFAPAGSFEAVVRSSATVIKVHVRYVGEQGTPNRNLGHLSNEPLG